MGRTVSSSPGYAPEDEFDPAIDDFVAKDRNYRHFDLPLSKVERETFTVGHDEICEWAFWPLVGYMTKERRFRRQPSGAIVFLDKERPIKFASHNDAALLQFYSQDLAKAYERRLRSTSFSDSVLAYRAGVGSNIHHSKHLFDEIRERRRCTAIAVDITSFFDRISHSVLHRNVREMRSVSILNDADYSIYRRMTRYEWVDSDAARDRLGHRYGRNQRICNGHELRSILRGKKPSIVQKNSLSYGIPQGTPLSGLYANISMYEFDALMAAAMSSLEGSYRRYSDDISIVVPSHVNAADAITTVNDHLATFDLKLSDGKTQTSSFSDSTGDLRATKPFQYLGFTFDGQRTLIRQSSLNRYYSKMLRGVRAKVYAAKRKGVAKDSIYMRELLRKYTHFGQYRNFPRYVYRAAEVHEAPEIRKQIKAHIDVFKRITANAIQDIY